MLGNGNFITEDVTKSNFPQIYVPLYLHYHLSTQKQFLQSSPTQASQRRTSPSFRR